MNQHLSEETIAAYSPFYHKKPNQFLHYETRAFDDGAGNGGDIVVAHYLNKSGKKKEAEARIIWKYGWPAQDQKDWYWKS